MRSTSVTFCYRFAQFNLTCFSTGNKIFSADQLNRANNQLFGDLLHLHHHGGYKERPQKHK
jgi:hypothetical protein